MNLKFYLITLFLALNLLSYRTEAIDRVPLVRSAFQHLGFYLHELTAKNDLRLNSNEREMLEQITELAIGNSEFHEMGYQLYSDELRAKFQSHFESNPAFFRLEDEQSLRTAVTTEDRDSGIYFNLNIINSDLVTLTYLDVLQILIHEIGHKVKNKNQAAIDSLGSKFKKYLEQFYYRQILPDSRILEMLLMSRTQNQFFSYRHTSFPATSIVPMAKKEIAFFISDHQSVFDVSSLFEEQLYNTKNLYNYEHQWLPEIIDTQLQIEELRVFPISANQDTLMQLQLNKKDQVIRPSLGSPNQFELPFEARSAPNSNQESLTINIRIPNFKMPYLQFSQSRERDLNEVAQLLSIQQLDRRTLQLLCKIPEKLLNQNIALQDTPLQNTALQDTIPKNTVPQNISLLINFDGGEFTVNGVQDKNDSTRIMFQVTLPRKSNAQWLFFDRLLINQKTEIYLDRGQKYNLAVETSDKPLTFDLKNIATNVKANKTHLELIVESDSPLRQLKLVRYKVLSGHQLPSSSQKQRLFSDPFLWSSANQKSPISGEGKTSLWQREDISLTAEQLQQTKLGPQLWQIKVEIEDAPIPTEYSSITDRVSNRISRFYTVTKTIHYPLKIDQGWRTIESIEITNDKLQIFRKQLLQNYTAPFRTPKCSEILDDKVEYADFYT